MKEYKIEANQENKTLFKFLKMVLPKAPDSFIHKMLRKKNIKLNTKKADGSEKLKIDDIVNIYLSDETFSGFQTASDIISNTISEYENAYKKFTDIDVVFENDEIVVMYKPAGILSQKAKPGDLSLNEWMIGYFLSKGIISTDSLKTFKPSILNRLDRNTKGLVIGAKTLKASQEVSLHIKNRTITKLYQAKVVGCVDSKLVLEGYLIKDEKNNKVSIFKNKPQNIDSSYIKTIIIPKNYDKGISLVDIDLVTGKTHQIRAHLASVGYPILGDPKYGNQQINKKYSIREQELTAYRLEFPIDIKIDSLKGLVVDLNGYVEKQRT